MRTGVTLSDITRAADQLLANGERPTIEGVRNILGTGSPATVNALLKQYFQSLPARLNLPAPIATAAAELYDKIRATALEEAAEQQASQAQQVAQERALLTQERQAFETEKLEMRGRMAGLMTDVERHQELQRQQAGKIASLERELTVNTSRAAAAEAQARAGEEERERLSVRHGAEIQRLREQAEGNERHLLLRTDELKTQLTRFQGDRDREAAAANKRIGELDASLSEALKLQASLRAELATAQRDLVKRQEAAIAAEAVLQRSQEELSREALTHRETMEHQRALQSQLERSVEHLKRERDDAMREAARVAGMLTAVQSQLEGTRKDLQRKDSAESKGKR